MAQVVLRVSDLPETPLAAAEAFHSRIPAEILQELAALPMGSDMVLVFPPSGQDHSDWRLAAVRDLARAVAPSRRVNGVVGTQGAAIDQVLQYLASAPGVTGQVFEVDGATG